MYSRILIIYSFRKLLTSKLSTNRRNAFVPRRSIFETVRVQTYPSPLTNVIIPYFSTQNPFHLRRTVAGALVNANESNGSRKTSLRKVINRERGVL